jgi:ubiquinone biosynthesis protein
VELLINLVFLALTLALVGAVTGRMLGIRIGRLRTVVVSFIGWFVGVLIAAILIGDSDDRLILDTADEILVGLPVIVFFSVLTAMPIAIILDLLTRRTAPRKRRWRRALLHPVRELKRVLEPYGRLREVVGHARHANLLSVRYASAAALDSPEFGRRLRLVLEESGGMLVKFGQIASTRTDMLPDAVTSELAHLRADVRPVEADAVRAVLEEELGEPVEQAFASFEWEPLAAASIGQTHRAVLHDDRCVVVKVQRPGVDDLVARDASVLRLAARQLERRVEAARRIGAARLMDELIAGIEEELDYLHEATAGNRLRENRADDDGIGVPGVDAALSTTRVLVMDEVIGRPVDDVAAVDASGVPRDQLARNVLSSFLGQILSDGLYHADPHPGNLFVDTSGTIWLLDFGSVGRLDPIALEGLQGIALGFALNDPSLLARAVRHLAGDEGATDLRALEADLGTLLGAIDATSGMNPTMVGDVLQVMTKHGLTPPASITLLGRAMLTLEGTLTIIDSGFDLASEGEQLVARDRAEMLGTPEEAVQRELVRALPALRTLPEHTEALANQLRAGRLSIRTERFAGGDRRVVGQWVDRAVLAIVGAAGALAAGLLLLAGASTADDDVQVALWILGFSGLTFATVLLMRAAAQALRRLPVRDD